MCAPPDTDPVVGAGPLRHRQLPRAGDAPRDPHPRVERAGAGVSERRRNLESSRK